MIKGLKIILLTVLCGLSLNAQDGNVTKNYWNKGDFFIGVNSDLLDVSVNSIGLTPAIGYSLSGKDMMYCSLWYASEPRLSTFTLGWQHLIYRSLYIGVNAGVYGEGSEWTQNLGFELGLVKPLWSWLIVSPKIGFVEHWNEGIGQFGFRTGVTFAVRLKS